jgi:D-alanine-D-alanine ligase
MRPPPGSRSPGAGSGKRVTLLYGALAPDAPPDELDVLVEVQAVSRALAALGHRVEPLALTLDLGAARDALRVLAPEVVFNLVESVGGTGALIYLGAGLLDALSLPFTGAGLPGMLQTSNKLVAKRLLGMAGVRTPPWIAVEGPQANARWPGQWIVKSVWEHASVGLDDRAVVADAPAARQLLAQRRAAGGQWLAEGFVEGREFNVSLLAEHGAPTVLPIAEIRFDAFPAGKPRIVGYAAKWQTTSFEYANTPRSFEQRPADAALFEELRRVALLCWGLFDLHGYARVDFRVDPEGVPWVLEVNCNPCLAPDAGFVAAAAEAGMDLEGVVRRVLADVGPAGPEAFSPDEAGRPAGERAG